MRVRSKKDIFDLGKKMIVDKGEMSRFVLCEKKLSLMKWRKEKRTRGTSPRDYQILRHFSIYFLASSKILPVCRG